MTSERWKELRQSNKMPEFQSEEEFNEFFKVPRQICDDRRNADGLIEFKDMDDFESFIHTLMASDGISAETFRKEEDVLDLKLSF